MEFARLKWGAGIAAVLVTLAVSVWRVRAGTDQDATSRIPGEGPSLEVEVLNATTVDGLARRVTQLLRRHGIDVVFYGSERPGTVAVTTLIVRRGDSTAAVAVRDALGLGHIIVDLATDGLLDVSVLLGPDASGLGNHP